MANEEFYSGRRVLLTGATGLVGGWLVQSLLSRGAELTCVVRDFVPNSRFYTEKLNERVNIVRTDLEDLPQIERTINEYEPEAVIHLGAQTIVGVATRSPLATFNANIRGTWNVLESCRLHDRLVKSVVVASSDKAYGSQEKLPYSEESPLHGESPYDCSKSCVDLLSQSYGKTYSMPIGISRCGNFFGGGDMNFSRIVPSTIQHAYNNTPPVIRTDGSYVRDYIYVKDAVSAYEFLAQKTYEKKFRGEAFNFSNEEALTVLEMMSKILKLMGKSSLKPIVQNQALNEIRAQHLSAKKAREVLGWKSAWPVEKGLAETVAWYEDYLKSKEARK